MRLLFILSVLFAPQLQAEQTPPVDVLLLDREANACEDFYQYACGGWLKKTELPADRRDWSRGFTEVEAKNEELLLTILEKYSKGNAVPPNSYSRQLGDVFTACMSEEKIEKSSEKDFQALIKPIQTLKSLATLPSLLADLHLKGIHAVFRFFPDEDFKDPTLKVMVADQGGMGLPTPEFYLSDKPSMVALRNAYQNLAESALTKAGYQKDNAKALSTSVLEFETKLAAKALLPVDRRDPTRLDNRLDRDGLMKLSRDFDWAKYLASLGLPRHKAITVYVPDYFQALGSTLSGTSIETLRAYLIVRTFSKAADAMDQEAAQAKFKFESQLYGIGQLPLQNRICLSEVSDLMGFALGRAFVDQTFSAAAKKEALEMVARLQEEMKANLKKVDWMDESTREAALKKLSKQKVYMGYPENWPSYDGLKVNRSSMLANRMVGTAFNSKRELSKLNAPADYGDWSMKPMEVNASNKITQNVIKFPAGILQPPNFSINQAVVANYGVMGSIVGHEVTHGYDDQGRQFDEIGAARSWWSEKTNAEFNRRAECIVKQYDSYSVDKDTKVNGKLVQGEAIADLGGMKLSYSAWKKLKAEKPESVAPKIEGFSEEQMFFLALGQAWCSKSSPAYDRFKSSASPYALDRFRVNGTVRNIPEFAQAFSCKEGTPLAPKDRCVVW